MKVLVLENPGRFKAQAEGQNLGAVHAILPVVVEAIIFWPSSGGNSIPTVEEPFCCSPLLPENHH
jgi:hypothetical protein